ncbi:MAG: phosphoribosylamine--glycine ligase [Microthrixaceae bacterium]|nr:phosphoribosylamine--glycine ligase [Microthrixaceae bacterium]MCO5311671.1 phosphoribosylamine--glycine ligase [Microthrixaceae bacterium]
MKVVVVGSGGREHALAATLSRTCDVVVTPGNPGIPNSVPDDPETIDADLYVIGPEQPLVDGLADRLRAAGKLVFGPGADGARLEGSKAYMKELLVEAGVPTAAHGTFTDEAAALEFLDQMTSPYVIKTDGLAGGKGVLVTESLDEARQAVRRYLSGAAFGAAGRTLIVEEGLSGPEISVFAICDGTKAVLLSPAQDFKRINDGDEGPNTGGMGAYTPVPGVDDAVLADVLNRFINPTLETLRSRGIDYRGVLFAGLMLTADGPRMLEYNVRFGDPECQVVTPRLRNDLAQILAEAAAGDLRTTPDYGEDALVNVVCAASGYPQNPRTGDVITGIEAAAAREGVTVYCAGVARNDEGDLVTAGGRVLNVVGRGATIAEARERAFAAIDDIQFDGMHVRRDIAAAAAEASW